MKNKKGKECKWNKMLENFLNEVEREIVEKIKDKLGKGSSEGGLRKDLRLD